MEWMRGILKNGIEYREKIWSAFDEHNSRVKQIKIKEREKNNNDRNMERDYELDIEEESLDKQRKDLDAAREVYEKVKAREHKLKDEEEIVRESEAQKKKCCRGYNGRTGLKWDNLFNAENKESWSV